MASHCSHTFTVASSPVILADSSLPYMFLMKVATREAPGSLGGRSGAVSCFAAHTHVLAHLVSLKQGPGLATAQLLLGPPPATSPPGPGVCLQLCHEGPCFLRMPTPLIPEATRTVMVFRPSPCCSSMFWTSSTLLLFLSLVLGTEIKILELYHIIEVSLLSHVLLGSVINEGTRGGAI